MAVLVSYSTLSWCLAHSKRLQISILFLYTGFRATVYGRILSATNNPPMLSVTRVTEAAIGCQDVADYNPRSTHVNCDSGAYLPYFAAHGSLMLIGWGFLLPGGIVAARFLRYREDSLWFQIHRVAQPLGLLFAVAGWITALAGPFDVLGSGVYDVSFAHAVMGTVAMILGLLQPINAFFRPHKPENGEAVSAKRKTWERVHKSLGYVAAVIAIVNCFIGMALSGKYSDQFLYALIASLGTLVLAALLACFIKRNHQQSKSDDGGERSGGPAELEEDHQLNEDKWLTGT